MFRRENRQFKIHVFAFHLCGLFVVLGLSVSRNRKIMDRTKHPSHIERRNLCMAIPAAVGKVASKVASAVKSVGKAIATVAEKAPKTGFAKRVEKIKSIADVAKSLSSRDHGSNDTWTQEMALDIMNSAAAQVTSGDLEDWGFDV